MKRRNDEKAPPPTMTTTSTTKKQKKESKKKKESLPPDVRTLWAKVTSTQAPLPSNRPDDYEPGDSDFEESSLSRTRSVSRSKSSNPPESNDNASNVLNIAPQNPLVRISNTADLTSLPNNLKPSGLVIGDGSCLPRSILLGLTGSQNGYQQLRQSVVQRIAASPLHFEPEILRLYNCSVDDYCARMADNFEFGDVIFIQAAAVVLEVEIQNSNGMLTRTLPLPSPAPPIVPAVPSAPLRNTTIRPGQNPKNRAYVVGVPYEVSYLAESVDAACLEPPPVFRLDGRPAYLFFEVPSWDVMWNGMRQTTRDNHEAAILRNIEKTGKTRDEIALVGSDCCGNTFELPGCFWVSTRCIYGKRLNVVTAGEDTGHSTGLSRRCRGCLANHNTLNQRLRMTFDVEEALRYKAAKLNHNEEWTTKVKPDISFSLVLKVLRNGGFIHLRTQADVNDIRKPLSKAEQAEHLTWIKANVHHGFRTGAELILLTEAGMCMASFDRSDSTKKIDELGQTVVADSWGFNRLSNSLSERAPDRLLREILAGDYAEGDAAFRRRNGGGEPKMLSREWEDAIEKRWDAMSVQERTRMYYEKDRGMPIGEPLQDIRVWTLPEFQRFCRLSANGNGNLVCEVTGVELSPDTWAVDRVVNGVLVGISGEYRNGHCLFMHKRLNDMKEICLFPADGRKVFATVETLILEIRRRNIVQSDHRGVTQIILRDYLNHIRVFRNSGDYRKNMDRLAEKKEGR
ncbi:hypothetical protein HK100_007339 [Physocladia obscura]|uniref:OTU domain-containing protein n=1 Tax=Physocladia obscura TaxID=109957 RepID=A0AAD5SR02_9FUNG|nr:hypothetical protein HK100_007339 [Physocladia obscura]